MAYKDPNDERAKESRRKHYRENKEAYIQRAKAQRLKIRQWVMEQKEVPCTDCGGKYPSYVMDFDHRDPAEKGGNIDKFACNGSMPKLREEIAKCDVVCANCHRERTYGPNGNHPNKS